MTYSHAFEWLAGAHSDLPDVIALFGSDATLRSWSLQSLIGDGDITALDGETTTWSDVRDDLATASLFDMGSKRTIVIRSADAFLKEHRSEIEKYITKPGKACRFVLELDTLTTSTRVYKALLKEHLLIGCSSAVDNKAGVTAASRRKFLSGYVAKRHQVTLPGAAVDALIEILGEEIGMLDTEVAKLSLYLDQGEKKIDEALVREVAAGWKGKTVWEINDAIAEGNAAEALRQLDKLMSGGQRPIALFPQMAWALRQLGLATAVVLHREQRDGRTPSLPEAFAAAQVKGNRKRAESQLKVLGRGRGKKLLPWLLDADLKLKGSHSQDPRDRFLLEHLVVKLAKNA
ncbi:MAG: DNA polymerase III subunit delta [Rubripirellula sp.]|nr:DNA polymerase III subunit delta [Rubripirellula sp.]